MNYGSIKRTQMVNAQPSMNTYGANQFYKNPRPYEDCDLR